MSPVSERHDASHESMLFAAKLKPILKLALVATFVKLLKAKDENSSRHDFVKEPKLVELKKKTLDVMTPGLYVIVR